MVADLNNNPLMILLAVGAAGFLIYLFIKDFRDRAANGPHKGHLPGVVPASMLAIVVGVIGAVLLVGLETVGEIQLGISAEQSTITAFSLLALISAGIVEEVIFRGYLVVQQKGTAVLIASIVGFSLLFALLHPHLWEWEEGFVFTLTTKGFWSTGVLFLNSLFFYAMRFAPFNPERSLIPCFAAHIASNLAVFGVKAAQGFVTWM